MPDANYLRRIAKENAGVLNSGIPELTYATHDEVNVSAAH